MLLLCTPIMYGVWFIPRACYRVDGAKSRDYFHVFWRAHWFYSASYWNIKHETFRFILGEQAEARKRNRGVAHRLTHFPASLYEAISANLRGYVRLFGSDMGQHSLPWNTSGKEILVSDKKRYSGFGIFFFYSIQQL